MERNELRESSTLRLFLKVFVLTENHLYFSNGSETKIRFSYPGKAVTLQSKFIGSIQCSVA